LGSDEISPAKNLQIVWSFEKAQDETRDLSPASDTLILAKEELKPEGVSASAGNRTIVV
jgi:hypothetical protein